MFWLLKKILGRTNGALKRYGEEFRLQKHKHIDLEIKMSRLEENIAKLKKPSFLKTYFLPFVFGILFYGLLDWPKNIAIGLSVTLLPHIFLTYKRKYFFWKLQRTKRDLKKVEEENCLTTNEFIRDTSLDEITEIVQNIKRVQGNQKNLEFLKKLGIKGKNTKIKQTNTKREELLFPRINWLDKEKEFEESSFFCKNSECEKINFVVQSKHKKSFLFYCSYCGCLNKVKLQ